MNIWDSLVDCICRPPRDVYTPAELLGGSNQTFMVGQMECTRLDFELTNHAGYKLQCSHYLPLDARSADGQLPVVVYCHCNSGSRRDAEEALYHLLPCGVGVVAFDFTGSGLSDGKWVTLGANEVQDLGVVVRHLRAQGGVSSIGLWGRSMGAVTALLYSHQDPDIAGMVLDSPFSRLTDLMLEIVVSQRLPIPKVMLKLALKLMRNSVRRKAGADINSVSPLDVVAKSVIPAMFGHGEEDSFINLQHSVKLFEAYNSAAEFPVYKNLVRFKGDHNHPRPAFFYSSVCCFFHQQLKLDAVLLGGNPADTQQLMKYGSLTLSSASEVLDRANGFVNTPWSLEPVSSLSQEDQEAAAAAAAALMTQPDEGGGGGGGLANSSSTPRAVNGAVADSSDAAVFTNPAASCSSSSSRIKVRKSGDHQATHAAAAAASSTGGGAAVTSSSGGGGDGGGAPAPLPGLRIAVRSSGSASTAHHASSGGVAHISEGGLNSPRAAGAGHKGRPVLSIDAGAASTSSSSGGGIRPGAFGAATAAAAAVGAAAASVGYESMEQSGFSSPSSPQSPRFQSPRLRSNSYTQRHQQLVQYRQQQCQGGPLASPRTMGSPPDRQQLPVQQQQQQRGGPRPMPLLLQQQQQQQQHGYASDTSWQLATAVPIAAAAAAAAGAGRTSDDLFTIGSRGAPADLLGGAAAAAAASPPHSAGGSSNKHGGISLALSGQQPQQPAAAAAAGGGANGAAAVGSSGSMPPSPGRAGRSAAGSQPFKWLFKRSSAGSSGSTAGSTPSTSPPAAGAAAAAAGSDGGGTMWRSKSAGSTLVSANNASGSAGGSRPHSATTAAAAAANGGLPALQLQGLLPSQQQQQQQLDDVPLSPLRSSRPSLPPAGSIGLRGSGGLSAVGSPTAAAAATSGAGVFAGGGAAAAGSGGGGGGVFGSSSSEAGAGSGLGAGAGGWTAGGGAAIAADEDDMSCEDPALAAAIAASLADQQQQQQQQVAAAAATRLPQTVDEEERMLQEAIALSLSMSGAPPSPAS